MSSKVSCDGGGAGSSSGSGGGSGGGGGGGPCGACKFLRRKCVSGCIFAPYFDQDQGAAYFAAVHKVFGASNVSKLLLHIPVHRRLDAVVTICYEAQARLRDPVYGCVSHIFALQQQVMNLQTELSYLQSHLAALQIPAPQPPPTPAQPLLTPTTLSISDLPTAATMPPSYDLSSLFEPVGQVPASWMLQALHHQLDPYHYGGGGATRAPTDMPPSGSGGGDDLQELARELFQRHTNTTVSCTQAPHFPPHTKRN